MNYFGKYGDITDSVIMKDRQTGRPRGFGFITYANPVVVDTVIAETHVINGKQVRVDQFYLPPIKCIFISWLLKWLIVVHNNEVGNNVIFFSELIRFSLLPL